ncbi:hypothetical protein JL721_3230 [Aureococcus anophagefferens]|nr:hypothetical protein JL721_3230 [Aureococcus anophagefferens]
MPAMHRRPPFAYVRGRKGAIVRSAPSLASAQVGVLEAGALVSVLADELCGDTERWEVANAADDLRGWVSAKVLAGVVAPRAALPAAAAPGDGRSRTARSGSRRPTLALTRYERLGRELYDSARAAFAVSPPSPLRRALEAVAAVCGDGANAPWMDAVDGPRATGSKDAPDGWPLEVARLPAWLTRVSLPLALYVRNTEQLYGLLSRLHGLRDADEDVDVEAALDGGETYPPSSWLLFSILGALQVLRKARRHPLRLEALATTSAGPACALGGPGAHAPPPFGVDRSDDDGDFMYRGLWVAKKNLDEDRLAMSSSFQSYSRHVPGVCHVLRFYASARGTAVAKLAEKDAHAIILVARGWRASDWVFPVEFFNDGALGGIEKELLVPPFVGLDFDRADDLVVAVPAADADLAARFADLRRKHQWTPPAHLVRILKGEVQLLGGQYAPRTADRLTIRFVTGFYVAPALRALFEDERLLYDFPPEPAPGPAPADAYDLAPLRACLRRAVDAAAVDSVRRRGYAVVDRALPLHFCRAARKELEALRARDLMIRNRSYSVAGQTLRLQVNDGRGGAFAYHCDTAANLDDRQLTVLCYLNEGWRPDDGGALRLVPYPRDEVSIEPVAGRLVVFDARNTVHATTAATRPRYCFTLWLSGPRPAFALPGYDAAQLRDALDFRPQACKLRHADAFAAALRAAHESGGAGVVRDHEDAVASIRASVDLDEASLDAVYRQLPWW